MRMADASSSALILRQIRLDTSAQEHKIFSPTLRPGLTLLTTSTPTSPDAISSTASPIPRSS
jgi:hypothetical protein